MRLHIEHLTCYVYQKQVDYSIQQLRLTPPNRLDQQVKHWAIHTPGQLTPLLDAFGNQSHLLVMDTPHESACIVVSGEIETKAGQADAHTDLPLPIYLRQTPHTEADAAIADFAQAFAQRPLEALMAAVRDKIVYTPSLTSVDTGAAQAFQLGVGVCQDHAHVFIACCRSLGLPARYVSGYLFTADGQHMHSHAWVDVWSQHQWRSLDIANGIVVGETYVRLATGLDYRSAGPLSGSRVGGGVEGMSTAVHMRLDHPFTEKQQIAYRQFVAQQAQQ